MNEGIQIGARNLLLNCADAKAGDRVLLIGEQCAAPFFDPRLCDDLAAVSYWWQAVGSELRGLRLVKAGTEGVLHEKIGCFSRLPE